MASGPAVGDGYIHLCSLLGSGSDESLEGAGCALVHAYAPAGQTPVQHERFNRDHLSTISAISLEGKLYAYEKPWDPLLHQSAGIGNESRCTEASPWPTRATD